MRFSNRGLLLFIFMFSLPFKTVQADVIELEENSTTDRIEQLSRTLSHGAYSNSDNVLNKENDTDNVPIYVEPKDYKDLGIKSSHKTYVDSDIWYLPKSQEYAEQKYFPNNIKFFKALTSNTALFVDMSDETATDDDYWAVSCSKDHITDEKVCLMGKYEMMFIRSSKTGWMFSVSKEEKQLNPMQYQYVRVDRSPALKSRTFFKGQTLNIIDQMKKGTTAYTRFYEWSGEYEETIPLKGFSIAFNTLNIMYSKL